MVSIIEHNKPINGVNIVNETRVEMPSEKDWPTPNQIKQLAILVKGRFPELAKGIDQSNHFKNALLFLMFARREPKPNTGVYLSYWVQVCTDWLERMGIPGGTNSDALIAAAACHGIAYAGPQYGSLGINRGETGAPQSSKWREVLATGRVIEPAQLARPAEFVPGVVDINIGGWRAG
jgi:hypothetical protein